VQRKGEENGGAGESNGVLVGEQTSQLAVLLTWGSRRQLPAEQLSVAGPSHPHPFPKHS